MTAGVGRTTIRASIHSDSQVDQRDEAMSTTLSSRARTVPHKRHARRWERSLAAVAIGTLALSALAVAVVIDGIPPQVSAATCSDGVVARLYLGQATPAGAVTDAQWRTFVSDSVAERFPDGFTELQADGRWRDERGATVDEHTRVVEIAHDGKPAARDRVRAIAADYRRRFAQQSVLVTEMRATYCFEN